MLEKVNYNIAAHPLKNVKNKNEVKEQSFRGTTAIASETSNAARAYGEALINKPAEQLSLKENIRLLKSRGKVEGKDYVLESFSDEETISTLLILNNNHGKRTKVLHYDNNDNYEKCNSYEKCEYKNGRTSKICTFDDENNPSYITEFYYDNDAIFQQKDLTPDGLTYNTSKDKYVKRLKETDIEYILKTKEYYDGKTFSVKECNNEGETQQETCWHYQNGFEKPLFVERIIFDNGKKIKNICFSDNGETDVTTYLK